jgi:hypothetical protein
MIIESPALDWITLSYPYTTEGQHVLFDVANQVGVRKGEARRIGYQGYVYEFPRLEAPPDKGTLFHGERTWKGKGWSLLIAPGESAHWLLEHLWQTDLMLWSAARCTRLDVQITIPWPEWLFYLRNLTLTQDVKASVVHGLDEKSAWAETIYLGSRSSPVMVRAYRKRVDEHGRDWLRVEVEYKREASKGLFWTLLGERHVGNWFEPVLSRCEELYAMIEPYLVDDPDRPKVHRVVGNTWRWLSTTVANCVCRLLDDDDQHEQTAELVSQWYAYSQACQNRRTVVE